MVSVNGEHGQRWRTNKGCMFLWPEGRGEVAERDGDDGEVTVVSPFLFTPVGLSRQEFSWHVLDLYN